MGENMKKVLKIAAICACVLFVILVIHFFMDFLHSFSSCFDHDVSVNNFKIYCNDKASCCFISDYKWDGAEDTKVINIPDKYENLKVTKLGGYFGRGVNAPFMLELPDSYCDEEDKYSNWSYSEINSDTVSSPYSIENIEFTLNVGKNIKDINSGLAGIYYKKTQDDGSVIFYHPVIYVNCDSANPSFYSKDGSLFEKKTNKLVIGFDYNDN